VTVDPGGAKGSLSGSLSVNVPDVSVSAPNLAVSFDTHAAASSFAITATGASVTIAGQSLAGDLVIQQGADAAGNQAALIAFENEPTDHLSNLLTIGPVGSPLLTVPNGSGELLITSAGVAGDVHLSGVSVSLPR